MRNSFFSATFGGRFADNWMSFIRNMRFSIGGADLTSPTSAGCRVS
ncbi:hypothetical protein [Paenibacillus harenae]